MQRIAFSLSLCFGILLTGTPAQSQTVVAINTGISVPISPSQFTDDLTYGFSVGGSFTYPLDAQQRTFLQMAVNYSNYAGKNQVASNGTVTSSGSGGITTLFVNLKRKLEALGSLPVPYLIGGAGLFRFTEGQVTATTPDSLTVTRQSPRTENSIGLGLGAGLELHLTTRTGFFCEAQYNIGFTHTHMTQHVPIKLGIFFQ